MLTEDRRGLILRELRLRGSLNVAEFAQRMGISGMTVRRDLALLEEQGRLQRVHGGAVANPEPGPAGIDHRSPAGAAGGHRAPLPAGRVRPASTTQVPLATIGMVMPSAAYYFPTVIRGAEAAARDLGVRLVLGVSNYSATEEHRQIERLLASGVDGLLVTTSAESLADNPALELLAAAEVPIVIAERSIDDVVDRARLESVRSDHVRGAEIAMNHLLDLGHQRIALCLRESSPTASRVREGYRIALGRVGLMPDPTMDYAITDARSAPEVLRGQIEKILDGIMDAGLTAAIVHNDEDALMFADCCLARGIRIPEDFALVAYDDEIASLGAVPLTAVAPPKYDVGYQALQMCLNRVGSWRGTSAALQQVSLSPTLVVRSSTVR